MRKPVYNPALGEERILLGKWTQEALNKILLKASEIKDLGERIDFISRRFLGIPYKGSTLTGGKDTPEIFAMNLREVDCFTFLDYVEAMSLSGSFQEFKENLKKVRYWSGKVSYESRNHFFTDWLERSGDFVADVTEKIGEKRMVEVEKTLNLKEDGSCFLPGIRPSQRVVAYIPSNAIDSSVLDKLRTGDYIGVYSPVKGLDVSHVGIFIKDGDEIYLRHASSLKKKVLDEDFRDYIAGKPGIVVLRPK